MTSDPILRRTLITAAVAMPIGYGIGVAWVLTMREPIRETVEVVKTPSQEALLALCEGLVPEGTHERLQDAVARIGQLEGRLLEKERELSALDEARADNEAARASLDRRRRMLTAEVEELRKALEVVAVERDTLLVELKETVEALDAQVVETELQRSEKERWRRVSTSEAWSRFVAETKISLCDRGTRLRQDNCETHLDQVFDAGLRQAFQECLLTNQAIPTLGQLEGRDDTLPPRAVAIPDDRSVPGRGHYIVLCDPALPEAETIQEPAADDPSLDDPAEDETTGQAAPDVGGEEMSLEEALDRAVDNLSDD